MPKTAAATAPNARIVKTMGDMSNIADLIFEIDHAEHRDVSDNQHEQTEDRGRHDERRVENAAEVFRRKQTDDADQDKRRDREEDAGEPAFGGQRADLEAQRLAQANRAG